MNREFYEKRAKAFYKRYYEQLEGATITKFNGMATTDYTDFNEAFPSFEVTLANGKTITLEVSRDEEGNGGGFLFGLFSPDMSDWNAKEAAANV